MASVFTSASSSSASISPALALSSRRAVWEGTRLISDPSVNDMSACPSLHTLPTLGHWLKSFFVKGSQKLCEFLSWTLQNVGLSKIAVKNSLKVLSMSEPIWRSQEASPIARSFVIASPWQASQSFPSSPDFSTKDSLSLGLPGSPPTSHVLVFPVPIQDTSLPESALLFRYS